MEDIHDTEGLDDEGILEKLINGKYSGYFCFEEREYVKDFLSSMISEIDDEIYIENIVGLEAMKDSDHFDSILDYRLDVSKGLMYLALASGYVNNDLDEDNKVGDDFYLKKSKVFFDDALSLLDRIKDDPDLIKKHDWDDDDWVDCNDFVSSFVKNLKVYKDLMKDYTEIVFGQIADSDDKDSDDVCSGGGCSDGCGSGYDFPVADSVDKRSVSFDDMLHDLEKPYQFLSRSMMDSRRYRDKLISDSVVNLLDGIIEFDDKKTIDSIYSLCIALSPARIRHYKSGCVITEFSPKIAYHKTYKDIRLLIGSRVNSKVKLEYFDQCYAAVKRKYNVSVSSSKDKRDFQPNI